MNSILKLFSLCAVILMSGFIATAQTTQIATLFHEGTVTNYTSATALSQALDAAVDGDVITLSSGLFQSANITKNVVIRGAGMGYPELGGTTVPTVLTGNFDIDCPDSETDHLYLEGLVHNETIQINKANGLTVLKCQFNRISWKTYTSSKWNNFRFVHCIFNEILDPTTSSLHFVNCAIKTECEMSTGDKRSRQFDNCVMYAVNSASRSNMNNCILILKKKAASYTSVNSDSSANHCIIVGCDKYNALNGDNRFYSADKASEIFTSEGLYNLSETVKDFAGTDGGQVGIHGGSLPFTPVTTNLKISKFKVAERTTADGKLPIEINIEAN